MFQERENNYLDKKGIFELAMKTAFKGLSPEEVWEYFKKEEKYIRDMYESATNEDKYRAIFCHCRENNQLF